MNKRNTMIAATALLVLLCGAWAFGLFGGTDPAVAELQQMADQAFNSNLPEAQQDQMRDQFRERMQALTPQQRDAFFEANRGQWQQRAEQRMDEFFTLTKQQQQQRLDEILDRMMQPRENRQREGGRGDRGGPGGGPGAGGDRGGWQNMTEAQREERSKRRLDGTSPKMRAQMSEFRKKLEQRAKERGISEMPRGPWGRGRG